MNRDDYKKYLNHPLWLKKRDDVFRYYGKRCAKCPSTKHLEVHHKIYAKGKMPWEYPIENFEVLCERHHREVDGYEYTPNKCASCGKEIREKLKYCINCHNRLVSEKEKKLKAYEIRITDLERKLIKKRKTGEVSDSLEIKQLKKERERMMAEKSKVERSLADIEKDRKTDTRRIESQISSLKKIVVSAVIIMMAIVGILVALSLTKKDLQTAKKSYEIDQNVKRISWKDSANHYGEYCTVEGKIVRVIKKEKGCFLNFHKDWWKHFSVVIFPENYSKFPNNIKQYYEGWEVEITGEIEEYKNRPEIKLESSNNIKRIKKDSL